jgi:hypothetical protein
MTPHQRQPLSAEEESCSPPCPPNKKIPRAKSCTRPSHNILIPLLEEDEENAGSLFQNECLPSTKLRMKKRRSFLSDRVVFQPLLIADEPEKKTNEETCIPEWIVSSKSFTPSVKILLIPWLEADETNTGLFQNDLPNTQLRMKKRRGTRPKRWELR